MRFLIAFIVSVFAFTGVAEAATVGVSSPWSRPAVDMGVVYLTLTNHGSSPAKLIKATSPVAKSVELHESTETKSPMGSMSGSSMSGMSGSVASMHPVASIPIPANGATTLSPGGYHIMLVGLHRPLQANQTFPVSLFFGDGSSITTTVHVRPM